MYVDFFGIERRVSCGINVLNARAASLARARSLESTDAAPRGWRHLGLEAEELDAFFHADVHVHHDLAHVHVPKVYELSPLAHRRQLQLEIQCLVEGAPVDGFRCGAVVLLD